MFQKEYSNWIKSFYNFLFKENISDKEYMECMNFKNEKMPEFLYQYTKVKHADDLLKNDLMFLRTFDNLNDPFDGDFLGVDEDIHRLAVEEVNGESYQIKKDVVRIEVDFDYKKEYRVACFSESNDCSPMWAFYGDNHKGICVGYAFHENSLFELFCYPIYYVESTNNDSITHKLIEDEILPNRQLMEIFIKKSESWNFENEWRIVLSDKKPFKRFNFELYGENKYLKFLKPASVYLGLKIDDDSRKRIIDLCKERNIKVFEMKKDTSGYNLIPKPVD